MSRKKKAKADPDEAAKMVENAPIPAPAFPDDPPHIASGGYDPDAEPDDDQIPEEVFPAPPEPFEFQRHPDGTLAAVSFAAKPGPRSFKYLQEDAHWFSLLDYGAVVDAMAAIRASEAFEGPGPRVLEFGPGPSTLALIEGGALTVDTCEDVEDWARVWDERLVKRFPGVVRQHRYSWPEGSALSVPGVDGDIFNLGFIDGPHGTPRRPDVLRYCLARCAWVLMPAEEWKTRAFLRPIIEEIAAKAGRPVSFTTTGPLSGAFALIGPPA